MQTKFNELLILLEYLGGFFIFFIMKPLKNEVVRIRDLCYSLIEYEGCNNCDFNMKDYCKLKSQFNCSIIYNSRQVPIVFKKYDSII